MTPGPGEPTAKGQPSPEGRLIKAAEDPGAVGGTVSLGAYQDFLPHSALDRHPGASRGYTAADGNQDGYDYVAGCYGVLFGDFAYLADPISFIVNDVGLSSVG